MAAPGAAPAVPACENRLQRVEARGEREALVIQLPAQVPGELGGLVIGQVEGHPCEIVRLTVTGKAVARFLQPDLPVDVCSDHVELVGDALRHDVRTVIRTNDEPALGTTRILHVSGPRSSCFVRAFVVNFVRC